ncbi:hypothetical protein IQ07DRAFT_102676 [Pyrenochaeta sp. DS3sAY3a]|nr:hypothetical protein IQ07DRAFT_102676 [Pyrenochaeta sp. DS3sAY3a]
MRTMSQQIGYAPVPTAYSIDSHIRSNNNSFYYQDSANSTNIPLRSVSQSTDIPLNDNDSHNCGSRPDSSGPWNFIKSSYLFVAHLIACVLFVVLMMVLIHGRNFRPGTPPGSIFALKAPLYQTQVNGLVSLGLVLVRLLSTCCTVPILWTMIVILLEKQGMSLQEISRVNDFQIPLVPRWKTPGRSLWYTWATLVIILIWPSNFAAPLANSSLAWNPEARDLGSPSEISLTISRNTSNDYWALRAPEWQMNSFLESVVRSGASPEYAFQTEDKVPLRRYFTREEGMTNNSTMNITLPYFEVQVRWIDASSDNRTDNLRNTTFSDYVGPTLNGVNRIDGSIVVLMDEPWNRVEDYPETASRFIEERLIAVKYNTWSSTDVHPDGTPLTECPRTSNYFTNMPGNEPRHQAYSVDDKSWGGDCYQMGIATFRAGLYFGEDCDITLVGSTDAAATCKAARNFDAVKEDWVAPVATKMLSEIGKGVVALGNAKPWINSPIEHYVSGLLTLSYHAAWSSAAGLMVIRENSTYNVATPMVKAEVDKGKLIGWLNMHFAITIAAVLVCTALQFSTSKFIRDTTLAALQLDFSKVMHHRLAPGLCDATTLSRQDHKLPMVKFQMETSESSLEGMGNKGSGCRRRVVFVDENGRRID